MGETSGASGGGEGGDADVEGAREGPAAGGAEVPGAAGFLVNLPWAWGWRVWAGRLLIEGAACKGNREKGGSEGKLV